jgi:hypothetical protein
MVKNVTIVTGGVQDKDWFKDQMDPGPYHWDYIDLRPLLVEDPSTSVGHEEDYCYEETQVAVIAQIGFPDVIKGLIDSVHHTEYVFLYCHNGYHRGSVTGKMLESQLNSLIDIDGNRIFNSICFMFHECHTNKEYKLKLSNVVDWLDNPWEIEGEYNGLKDSLFGYRSAMTTGASARNWNTMHDIINAEYTRIGKKTVTFNPFVQTSASMSSFIMPPPPSTPPTPSHIMPPRPPPPVVVHSKASSAKPPEPPQPPSASDYEAQQHPFWQGEQQQLPAWATLERDVRVWWSIFDHWALDVEARESLFALAQHSDQGYEAANELVGKLLKKKNDRSIFNTSASAFVFSSVLNARAIINPGDEGDRSSKRGRY